MLTSYLRLFWLLLVAAVLPLSAQTRVPVRLALQLGHSGGVTSVAFSPDGRFVLTGSWDQTARLWVVATGASLRVFQGHSSPVTSVSFSPDGRFVLTGSQDQTARLWDVATGAGLRIFQGHSSFVTSVAFSPNGRFVLTGGGDQTARLWDAATGAEVRRFVGHTGVVRSVTFSPDGRLILTGSGDTTARIWNAETSDELRRLLGHSKGIASAAFSPDGRFVLTGSGDKTIRLWDAATSGELRQFVGQSEGGDAVCFSPDGRFVLAGGEDARVWDLRTGAEVHHFRGPPNKWGTSAASYSPDGRFVLTEGTSFTFGPPSHYALLRDAATGNVVRRFEGHSDPVGGASFSPDGRNLLTRQANSTARVWDLAIGTDPRRLVGHSTWITEAEFSADGRLVLTASGDKTARLWNAATGAELRRFEGHSDRVASADLSPDGRFVLTAGGDATTRLWDARTGDELRRFESDRLRPLAAFSPDGGSVLTVTDHALRVWDAATGTQLRTVDGDPSDVGSYISFVAVSKDGRFKVTRTGQGTARFWNATTNVELRPLKSRLGFVHSAAFSSDGQFVVTVSDDAVGMGNVGRENTLRLWDGASGAELRGLRGNPVTSVAFSPDNRTLLIANIYGYLGLWDLASWVELRRFEGHSGSINSAAFSPDGRFIVTAGVDGTTRLWHADTAKWAVTMVSFGDGGWAVIDPEGRYDASDPDNSPGLYWLAGNTVIELKQLKDLYYSKGLLSKIFNGSSLKPVARFNQVYLPPEVTVASVDALKAEIVAKNQQGGFGDVVVTVNGREVPQTTPSERPVLGHPEAKLTVDLSQATLDPSGHNIIQVIVKNQDNTIASRYASGSYQSPPLPKKEPRLFALLAGVSQYPESSGLRNLSWAAKDALDMKAAIEVAAKRLFPAGVEIQALATQTGREPTKRQILAALDEIARKAGPQDVLLVYLAGHGASARTPAGDVYYFLPAESLGANVQDSVIAEDAISSLELKTWMTRKNMPFKQLLILDTCAAGAMATQFAKISESRAVSAEDARVMETLKDRSGMHILMGSAQDGVSYEASQYAQGLLTYSLLLGMRAGDLGPDGSIEVDKWFGFAVERVPKLAKEFGGTQMPVVSSPKGQPFPIGILASDAERAQIPISSERPILLPPKVNDDDDRDNRQLGKALNQKLVEISRPAPRDGKLEGARLVYVDRASDDADDVPRMVKPYVRYSEKANQLVAEVRLRTEKRWAAEGKITAPQDDVVGLAGRIVQWIETSLQRMQRAGQRKP